MGTEKFTLNEAFNRNAREYQTRPVMAAKYEAGMETGFVVYFSNKADGKRNVMQYEGVKIFPSEKEALNYIKADHKQYIWENGKLIKILAEYDEPRPVLHRKIVNAGKRGGIDFNFGSRAFLSDESGQYDIFILEDNCWVIQELDENIRVWYQDSGEPFFRDEYICEEVCSMKHCDAV